MEKKNKDTKQRLFEVMGHVDPNFKPQQEEGVGDKYLARKYGIPDPEQEFEKKFQAHQATKDDGEVFHRGPNNWAILKNPKNLNNVGPGARGVIMDNGDLYLENFSEVIHNDILEIMWKKGLFPAKVKKNWNRKLPQESNFLTVQRYNDSPYIAIGESNKLIYNEEDYAKYKQYYEEYLNKARSKNPGIQFQNRLVGTKALDVPRGQGKTNLMREFKEPK